MEFRRVLFRSAGFALTSRVNEFDLTDGSGRGILVATGSLYLNLNTVNTGRINYVHAKIIYRLKNVTLQEYVGIVQSQQRSEEHTSELQSLMRISYAVFCLKKKKKNRK